MRNILWVFVLFLATKLSAQLNKEKELSGKMTEVTVFFQAAQITREADSFLSPGKSNLIIKSLTPHMDKQSIQVKALGDLKVLSVNHRLNYLSDLKRSTQTDSISTIIKKLNERLEDNEAKWEVLDAKEKLLIANKTLGENSSLQELRNTMLYYDEIYGQIKEEKLDLVRANVLLEKKVDDLTSQISDIKKHKELPVSEIVISVEASKPTKAKFRITYLTSNAGWFPKYDVRVREVAKPMDLTYKAEVYQNTGIDWLDVKLKFSNAEPTASGVVPTLQPWYLDYGRNIIYKQPADREFGVVTGRVVDEDGEPLPGVNVIMKGSNVGTVTDIDGNFSVTKPNGVNQLVFSFIGLTSKEVPINNNVLNVQMSPDVQQLSEVVVTAQGTRIKRALSGAVAGISGRRSYRKRDDQIERIATNVIENQTTVEFAIDEPYSIKSNGQKLNVELLSYEVEASYRYYAVPKLDKDAFLVARVANWDQYNLLEGEANLYFEDAYVGRTILDAKSLADTLDISLGRDKSIVVGRTKNEEFSKTKMVGLNKVVKKGFEIMVRNKKSAAIDITLYDQVPVPTIDDISVDLEEISGGTLNESIGEITWDLTIEPNSQVKKQMVYEVKHPRRERVILE